MTTVLRLRLTVGADRQLHLMLPADFPPGEVEITVRTIAAPVQPPASPGDADTSPNVHWTGDTPQ